MRAAYKSRRSHQPSATAFFFAHTLPPIAQEVVMTLKRYPINEALTWAGFVLLFTTAVLIFLAVLS
jgi:hypothetical protein